MTGKDHPCFLYMQIPAVLDSGVYLSDAESLASEFGGTTLASVDVDAVECLEPGTPECAIFLIEFKWMEQFTAFWTSEGSQSLLGTLGSDSGLLALAVSGLPYLGLPDALEIPTIASVKPPESSGPRAFMVIQGCVTDQKRIDQYRDVLLPMIAAAEAYYTAFEIAGGLQVLVGEWSWEIFAISRWPDHAAGHAVWDSERYQTRAIPIRTGAGTFNVHFFNGLAG